MHRNYQTNYMICLLSYSRTQERKTYQIVVKEPGLTRGIYWSWHIQQKKQYHGKEVPFRSIVMWTHLMKKYVSWCFVKNIIFRIPWCGTQKKCYKGPKDLSGAIRHQILGKFALVRVIYGWPSQKSEFYRGHIQGHDTQ